jgi:thioredoxin-like negative regulator of GroEL
MQTKDPQNHRTFDGDESELDAMILSHTGIVVVTFSVEWGIGCIAVRRLIETLAREYTDHLFLEVDVDANPQLRMVYAVSTLPHLKFFRSFGDGTFKEVGRVLGGKPDEIRMTLFKLR